MQRVAPTTGCWIRVQMGCVCTGLGMQEGMVGGHFGAGEDGTGGKAGPGRVGGIGCSSPHCNLILAQAAWICVLTVLNGIGLCGLEHMRQVHAHMCTESSKPGISR